VFGEMISALQMRSNFLNESKLSDAEIKELKNILDKKKG